jgi:AmiR/NasT family two-component response regulator
MTDATAPEPPPVLALVKDLIFASRITATARAAGVPVRIVRDARQLPGQPGRLLIVDLNQPSAIDAAAAWQREMARPAVGFVSHVDAETINQARAAGIDRVLARSAFVERLHDLLVDG